MEPNNICSQPPVVLPEWASSALEHQTPPLSPYGRRAALEEHRERRNQKSDTTLKDCLPHQPPQCEGEVHSNSIPTQSDTTTPTPSVRESCHKQMEVGIHTKYVFRHGCETVSNIKILCGFLSQSSH
jgi:hypothetical protein